MRLLFLSIGLVALCASFTYFFQNPQISLASLLSSPPAELTEESLNSKSLLATSIELSPPSYSDTEWPFADKVVPVALEEDVPATEAAMLHDDDFCVNVPIILYHHIQPLSEAAKLGHAQLTVDSGIFEKQMEYIASSGYTAISADQLISALQNHEELPEKSIVITIDDGYIDNYAYAFLMAKKYKLIINFMIPTGLIGKPDYMTWDHLKEMASNEYARIYNHTDQHAALGLLSEEQIEKELMQSKEVFKEHLDMDINIFTYPYGSTSPRAVDLLQKNGFIGAFTTNPGRKQCSSEIMMLHRDHVGNAPLTSYGL